MKVKNTKVASKWTLHKQFLGFFSSIYSVQSLTNHKYKAKSTLTCICNCVFLCVYITVADWLLVLGPEVCVCAGGGGGEL